jgi:hypothetical protein
MINGWPIAHHVFDGSLRDSATVEMVLNLALLRQRGQGYLVGLKRRRDE